MERCPHSLQRFPDGGCAYGFRGSDNARIEEALHPGTILWTGSRPGTDPLLPRLVSIVIVAPVQFFIDRAAAFRDK